MIAQEDITATAAYIHVELNAGDNFSASDSDVGCNESCEPVACNFSSYTFELSDETGNQVVVDQSIYSIVFKHHVVTVSSPRKRIAENLFFENLEPNTTYKLTVSFPSGFICNVSGPSARSISFTTLDGEPTTQLPFNLQYDPDSVGVEINQEAVSPTPTVEGTAPFTYEIAFVNPTNNNVTASIDSNTGIIRLTSTTANDVQGYQVDVRVSNAAGEAVFGNAFIVGVFDEVSTEAPTNLVYDPDTVTYNGMGVFNSVEPSVSGEGPFVFSIAQVTPESGAGAININEETGVITAVDLFEFGTGTYQVSVTVANASGSTTFNQIYTLIVEASSG